MRIAQLGFWYGVHYEQMVIWPIEVKAFRIKHDILFLFRKIIV